MSSNSLGISDNVYTYLLDHSLRETEELAQLREITDQRADKGMRVSPEQGQFMQLLAHLVGARRHLEVGTFTGYGALWMALALPADGHIVTCDIDAEAPAIGQRYWQQAGIADKIELRLGPAVETLDHLIANGGADTFDMAFIDADKENYPTYYERCMTLVRIGGLILIDNVLWNGSVADPDDRRETTDMIRQVNAMVRDDDRIRLSMLPIGDGLTIARRLV